MSGAERNIVRQAYSQYIAGRITKQEAMRILHRESSRNGYDIKLLLREWEGHKEFSL